MRFYLLIFLFSVATGCSGPHDQAARSSDFAPHPLKCDEVATDEPIIIHLETPPKCTLHNAAQSKSPSVNVFKDRLKSEAFSKAKEEYFPCAGIGYIDRTPVEDNSGHNYTNSEYCDTSFMPWCTGSARTSDTWCCHKCRRSLAMWIIEHPKEHPNQTVGAYAGDRAAQLHVR